MPYRAEQTPIGILWEWWCLWKAVTVALLLRGSSLKVPQFLVLDMVTKPRLWVNTYGNMGHGSMGAWKLERSSGSRE